MKKPILSLLLTLLLTSLAIPVMAQSTLTLLVRKEFGFNAASQINGTFSMDVNTDAQLASVTYKVDGQVLQEVKAPPFKIQFKTGSYAIGWHDLTATAVTTSGQTLESPAKRFQFVSADQQSSAMGKMIFPILGAVAVLLVVMMAFQLVIFRSKKHAPIPLGEPRKYGISGGAICPRCGRPFAIHWYAMNLFGKLDRCDHCGRWGIFHQKPLSVLRAAEAAELTQAQPASPIREETPEEQLRKQLDSSRYEDI
jgi:hypothetical protein